MSVGTKLTFEQFQEQYGQNVQAYEFWYGEAIPKAMPTWVHALLQKIIARLLDEQGFISGGEVELRIVTEAHPRPDVIAVTGLPAGLYQTEGAAVVVEIISEDDDHRYLREKCRRYQDWGCGQIYVVDPLDRSIFEWRDGSFTPRVDLSGIPAERIWKELDQVYSGNRKSQS